MDAGRSGCVWQCRSLDGGRCDSLLSQASYRPTPASHAHARSGPRTRDYALFCRSRCWAPRAAVAMRRPPRTRPGWPSRQRQPAAARVELTPGVAAAHPYAVDAGLAVLRAGGGAADAAVAVQAALGLVEPQSSGLGGGAFLLYYDAQTGAITAFNGRETAPAGATPDMFLDQDGKPLSYSDAVTSGRSTGVPGAVAMLGLAHSKHGRLPWADLFDEPVRLAADGFVVPQRLGRFANSTFAQATLPDARALFTHADGTTIKAGDTLRNPAYAETLRTIADPGAARTARRSARGEDRRAHASRTAPRHAHARRYGSVRAHRRPRRSASRFASTGVRAAAALERCRRARTARLARTHRHRRTRARRSAGLVPVCRSEPADVRGP